MDDTNMNPFEQDGQGANPYAQQAGANPYGQQAGANPYGQQAGANPYGQQAGANPYAQQAGANPYGQQAGANPYGQQAGANPYGQQAGSNPYGQQAGANPYAQPAVNPYSAGGGAPVPPKEPRKKMSKKMKILIFSGIAAVLLGVGLYFLFTRVVFPPKKTLRAAVDNTLSAANMMGDSLLAKEFGLDTLVGTTQTKGGSADLSLKLKKYDAKPKLEGLSVDVAIGLDKSAKQMSVDGKLTNKKNESIEAEAFADEERMYFIIKDLMDGYGSVTNKNIVSALKQSPLLQGQDLSALNMIPDISLNLFSTEQQSLFTIGDDFWDEVSVSRSGSEKLTVGEDSISAKKYAVTIPKEKIQEKVEKALDQYMEVFANSSVMNLLAGQGISSANIDTLKTQIKAVIKGMFTEDVVIYVFLDGDKVVGIKTNGELHLAAYTMAYEASFTVFSDDTKSVVGLDASLSVMGQKISLTGSVISKKDGEKINTTANAALSAAGRDALKIEYKQIYDGSDKSLRGTGSISVANGSDVSISMEGAVTELDKGKKLGIRIDELALTYKEKTVSVEGNVLLRTLDDGATVKTRDTGKKTVDLLAADKNEVQSLLAQDKLLSFKMKLDDFFN